MRLLLINHEYPPIGAGAANATYQIARSATALGHQVTVLTAGTGANFGWIEEDGVTVCRLRTGRARPERSSLRERATFVIRGAFEMYHVLRRSPADGCIVFFSIPCGPLGLLFWWLGERPYVVSLRGPDVPGSNARLKWMHAMLRPLRRWVLRRAAAIVANSPGLAEQSLRADALPVKVIPNGVDIRQFNPASLPAEGQFRFLFVGRLDRQKNAALLIEAMGILANIGVRDFRASIVGDGPLGDELAAQAERLGVADRIDWVSWLPRDEMPATYREAHCLVNPSRGEGMSNVVLEAMACGLPVIVTDVAGNRDVVESGSTGLIVPSDDAKGLAGSMKRVLNDVELRSRLATAGRAHIVSGYSWDTAADAYIRLLSR